MRSLAEYIVDRYLDWKAFKGSGDPLLDVSSDSGVNEIRYGKPGSRRIKIFDKDQDAIDFFNSKLKSNYQDPDDFTIGNDQEPQKYLGDSSGGLENIEGSWALDVPDTLKQLEKLINRDTNLEVGPYRPSTITVSKDENLEDAIEKGINREQKRVKKFSRELEEEFTDQTADYLGAATVKAVTSAYTPEETPSVDWYKEQMQDKDNLFSGV